MKLILPPTGAIVQYLARPNREYVKPRAALGLFFHAGMAHVLVCYGSRVSSKTIG